MAILSPTPGAWGAEASPWGSYFSTGTVTGAAVTLGAGWWFVATGAHNAVIHSYNPGTSSVTALAASSAAMVFSDGVNTTITNDTTGGTAASYAKLLLDTV